MQTTFSELQTAVIEQHGYITHDFDSDNSELRATLEDVARHGADSGFGGFAYYSDTCRFFADNKSEIVAKLKDDAESYGMDVVSMVSGFNCLTNDSETRDEIGRAVWGTPEEYDYQVQNALAWYALEETARELVDF